MLSILRFLAQSNDIVVIGNIPTTKSRVRELSKPGAELLSASNAPDLNNRDAVRKPRPICGKAAERTVSAPVSQMARSLDASVQREH